MQYSETTNNTGIVQQYETLTNHDFGDISGNTTKLQRATQFANKTLSKIWSVIFLSTKSWIYDDKNQTDLPQATANLVNGQALYALPSDAFTIQRVEIKDDSGNFNVIHPISLNEINGAVDEYHETDAQPIRYRLVDDTIELFPAPDYGSTGGLKVYFERGSVSFSSDDTTQTPGFISEYHHLVPLGMAIEWYKIHSAKDPALREYKEEFANDIKALSEVMKKRFPAKKPRLTVRKRRFV